MSELRFEGSDFSNQIIPLIDGTISVGRNPRNMIVIQDESVSGQHCEILVYGNEVIIRDLGSKNGTFIDGTRINPQSELKHGHSLRLGRVQLRLFLADASEDCASALTAVDAFRDIRSGRPAKPPVFPMIFSPSRPQSTPG